MVSESQVAEMARQIRRASLRMVSHARAAHIGSALSIADILAVLYGRVLCGRAEDPAWPGRDRFILSKGHACVALYATLARCGYFAEGLLDTYGAAGSMLMNHVSHRVPGVEFSTGSLGHGLPFGTGKALAAYRLAESWRVFVLLSDGEMDEGSNWEAMMFAAHHQLDNLVAIIDYNKLQSLDTVANTLGLEPLREKGEAFGWAVREVDGHNYADLESTLASVPWMPGKPSLLVAHTVKGKGVSFMENRVEWHYRSPDQTLLLQALSELEVPS